MDTSSTFSTKNAKLAQDNHNPLNGGEKVLDKVEELLTRGVDKIYPSKEDLKKVLKKKKITLYQGFDPTGDKLHIGHMIGLRKLAQFQKEGHTVIFLIGTATGQAGDPSGKTTAREKFLSEEELRKNAKDYIMQAGKIVNFNGNNPIKTAYNSDWFNEMRFSDLLLYLGNFSVQQLLERDLFQDRIKSGEPINLRAFLYPVLQGIDSFKMRYGNKTEHDIQGVDLEIGGTDQTFNMLRGRDLVKIYCAGKDKFVMTTPLLTDSKGVKIGKSESNVIGLTDKPEDLFGKIMALPDDVITKGLEYLTDVSMDEIKNINEKISTGENPIPYKKRLAFEIVKQLNDEKQALNAQNNFEQTVQGEKLPDDIPVFQWVSANASGPSISHALFDTGLVGTISEGKRVTVQGGTAINDHIVNDPNTPYAPNEGDILRVGKRKFVKIKITG